MLRLLFFLLIFSAQLPAQTTLAFHPCYGKANLMEDTFSLSGSKLHFETLRFYISNVQVLKKGRTIWKEKNSYHLIDAAEEKGLSVKLLIPPAASYDEIKFNLGIDSVTNFSGALGGDLDPTKGMYWTWQSGYINMKLEGTSPLCETRNHAFEFHLGGYIAPFASIQTVALPCTPARIQNIYVDVSQFISNIDLTKENQVMSPGEEAVILSGKAVKMFGTKKP